MKKSCLRIITMVLLSFFLFSCSNKKKSYTIIWKNYNGDVLQTGDVENGVIPIFNGETPNKPSTAEFTYEFIGWNPEVGIARKNQTYQAIFAEHPISVANTCSVVWKNYNGDILETQDDHIKGTIPIYTGPAPIKPNKGDFSYVFAGWSEKIVEITSDKIYIATFHIDCPERYVLATDEDFSGSSDGEFVYTGAADYVIIPEYIKGVKLTTTGNEELYLFSERTDIKGVSFAGEKSVVDLSWLFCDNTNESLELIYLDTSNVENMSYMFYYSCATTLDLSRFDTSNVTNMSYMFSNSELTEIDVSSFNTSKVTNMEYMFYYLQATSLNLSGFETRNVTDMHNMFALSKIKILDLSTFNTKKVTDMSMMFFMSEITSLNIISFDTSKVTNMESMFSNTLFTTLDVSHFDTSNVTNMSSMFSHSEITSLDLSYFNTSKVTDMNMMFSNTKMASLDLSNFDTSNVTNMMSMFSNSLVTTLNVSSFDTSKVTQMYMMFGYTKMLTLDLSSFDTSAVIDMNYMFYNCAATTGYAKNQTEADKFNAQKNIFTVK